MSDEDKKAKEKAEAKRKKAADIKARREKATQDLKAAFEAQPDRELNARAAWSMGGFILGIFALGARSLFSASAKMSFMSKVFAVLVSTGTGAALGSTPKSRARVPRVLTSMSFGAVGVVLIGVLPSAIWLLLQPLLKRAALWPFMVASTFIVIGATVWGIKNKPDLAGLAAETVSFFAMMCLTPLMLYGGAPLGVMCLLDAAVSLGSSYFLRSAAELKELQTHKENIAIVFREEIDVIVSDFKILGPRIAINTLRQAIQDSAEDWRKVALTAPAIAETMKESEVDQMLYEIMVEKKPANK